MRLEDDRELAEKVFKELSMHHARVRRPKGKNAAYKGIVWWPGETRFEIMVGAILTQNTNWGNVERAIKGLREKHLLSPKALASAPVTEIAGAIRPSGYFNQKAKRLKLLAQYLIREYSGKPGKLFEKNAGDAREELLSLHGIGKETADDMLLYAGRKLVFPVDAYTIRLLNALSGRRLEKNRDYELARAFFEKNLPHRLSAFQLAHGAIVEWGKRNPPKRKRQKV